MKLFSQSFTILLACLIVLIINITPLYFYIAPILGLMIIFSVIYIVIKQRTKKSEELLNGSNLEVFTVVVAILLIVFITGGLSSNLYFLLYFLIFGIVFLFQPATVIVLLLGFLVVFYQSIFLGDMFSNIIKLASLVFLTPISYFFGREFSKHEKLEAEVKDKTGQIIEDAKTLASHTKNEEAIDEIEDIVDKAEELQKES